jgi:exopolyphosphatase/guanosine-5'-triphosphate,3'-diphosphate pyrophosphatase
MQRYHVDALQAEHVELLGINLLRQLAVTQPFDLDAALRQLSWAARLHEIGLSIAHSGFHKHSAYIIEHADMPGFSKKEQSQLSRLVLGQRGSLNKVSQFLSDPELSAQILALRLAVLFYRSRQILALPDIHLQWDGSKVALTIKNNWLTHKPLTETALENEAKQWKSVGLKLEITSALPS